METFEDDNNNLYLLLGSYENLLIYSINIKKKEIKFLRKALLFKNADINDVLKLKDGKFLICSSNNNIKFIEFMKLLLDKSSTYSRIINTTNSIFKLIQELKGEPDSKNIFTLIELSNENIVSGDCENIILWKKTYLNYKTENSLNSSVRVKNPKNSRIFIEKKNTNTNIEYEFKKKRNKKFSHTYCMLEIKNINNEKNINDINNINKIINNIILAVAQPDIRSIDIIEIQENGIINVIKTIHNVNTVPNRKNIMIIYKNYLLVGCKDKLIIIDVNNFENVFKIYSNNESITYINYYLNEYFIFGSMKNKSTYNYEGYLSQKKLVINDKMNNLISVSEFERSRFEGNIINACKYIIQKKEIIITIGTNGKILILITS